MAINSYFQNIADAIRAKTGSVGLITPGDMPQAIADIPTGGGSTPIAPIHENISNGYISGTTWYGGNQPQCRTDIYEINDSEYYLLCVGTAGNRFRFACFNTDPETLTSGNTNGSYCSTLGSYAEYSAGDVVSNIGIVIKKPATSYKYIAIMKSNTGQSVNSYLFKLSNLTGE